MRHLKTKRKPHIGSSVGTGSKGRMLGEIDKLGAVSQLAVTLSPADIQHRRETQKFVQDDADPDFQFYLLPMMERWHDWNEKFFGGAMVPPYIELAEPKCPQALADYAPKTGFGGKSRIRVRPSLMSGRHRLVNAADPVEGIHRFVNDLVGHEMCHQAQYEIYGDLEEKVNGHGPLFEALCNRIGNELGLPPVKWRRRKNKSVPICSGWPYNVQPHDYYLGAFLNEDKNDDSVNVEQGVVEDIPQFLLRLVKAMLLIDDMTQEETLETRNCLLEEILSEIRRAFYKAGGTLRILNAAMELIRKEGKTIQSE